ncbi:helix-turn-helix domain-containing protein [Actinoplanes sp. NPDC023936]|uniref:TetR/AcrR family transcriptional regulator n=1 Tax=Actinoplanes sp. NPDC023936 TaxID=3154910 RepID=UPI0033F6627B
MLDAALTLLDEGGPDAATLRGMAARVDVTPNTMYTYFPDKAAVFKALVERLLGQADHGVFADRGEPWRQRVESCSAWTPVSPARQPRSSPRLGSRAGDTAWWLGRAGLSQQRWGQRAATAEKAKARRRPIWQLKVRRAALRACFAGRPRIVSIGRPGTRADAL